MTEIDKSKPAIRVVLLTDADVFAGTERHMLDLARGLRVEGVNVTIACPSPALLEDAARAEGIPILTLQKRGMLSQEAPNTLAKLLRSGEADIIHSHNGRSWLIAALAVSRAGRGYCFATQHFIEPNHATQSGIKGAISKAGHHWVVSKTSRIIAISEAVKQSMLDRNEAPADKITVVPNGITAPKVEPGEAVEVRRALGIDPSVPLIVCAARLEAEKDISTLISAMQIVVQTVPDAICLVAGVGSQQAQLNEQIAQLNLEKSVKLLGFRKDAHALIAACDLFVLPSLAEPFGLVLLEAMALGKPVVATNAGGPVEIVEQGETGLLVTPRSPQEMADAIVKIIKNHDISVNMKKFTLKRYQELFTVERMARDMHYTYVCQANFGST